MFVSGLNVRVINCKLRYTCYHSYAPAKISSITFAFSKGWERCNGRHICHQAQCYGVWLGPPYHAIVITSTSIETQTPLLTYWNLYIRVL